MTIIFRQLHFELMLCFTLWLFLLIDPIYSYVPPPSSGDDSSDGESIDATRRRLGLGFNYTPSLLHPELCRYLSEDECRDADESLQEHAHKMRNLNRMAAAKKQQQRQQQLRYTANSTQHQQQQREEEERELSPAVGVVKVLVILLQFPDHTNRTMVDPSVYDEIWNGNGRSDLIPSGSVARWFQLNSYGLYEIEAVIVPWTQSDNTELYYSFQASGLVLDFQKSFWPALDKLDAEGIDWSPYDIDNDGKLDAVVVLHSGYGAELKGLDCNTKRDYIGRIWSHAYATSFNSWSSSDGNYQLGGYVVASAFRDRCGSEPARIGVMTHEFMHTFGLVDLYDGQEARVGRGVGGFDIMATPYGPKDDPAWPGHLSAWSRIMSGWLKPIEIVEDGEYSIQASELSNQAYIIRKPYPFKEYLLIENRQPLWFDARLWTGGLVVYHVDDRANLQMRRGFPGQEGWPRNGNHYQVAVLAPDGQYNLEKGDNVGDVGDFWQEGMTLGPGNGRVFPNTDAYQFGSIRVTGVKIYDIKKVDTVMTFRVSGLTETAAPTPTEITIPPTEPGHQSQPTSPELSSTPAPSSDPESSSETDGVLPVVDEVFPDSDQTGSEDITEQFQSSGASGDSISWTAAATIFSLALLVSS